MTTIALSRFAALACLSLAPLARAQVGSGTAPAPSPTRSTASGGGRTGGAASRVVGSPAQDTLHRPGFHPCLHDVTSMLTCPSDAVFISPASITSVTITVKQRRGKPMTYELTGRRGGIDALFLSLDAIDKFAMPYYAQKYGWERAVQIREDIKQGKPYPIP